MLRLRSRNGYVFYYKSNVALETAISELRNIESSNNDKHNPYLLEEIQGEVVVRGWTCDPNGRLHRIPKGLCPEFFNW